MISIDITDREAKVVVGTNSGGRIKILSSVICPIKQGTVLDGVINDIAAVATDLHDSMKTKNINERTAVVTVSSSQIVFKELYVPKAKKDQFNAMVNNQIHSTMGFNDEYNVTYTVVSESVSEDGVAISKVLVTACPQMLVETYKQLFSMLGIRLKAIYINSSSVTSILLADEKTRQSMPLLSVQLNESFISINLYEESQLSFSRHVRIDSSDNGDNLSNVSSVASENILRMIQFHNSKRDVKSIEHLLVYGDTNVFESIAEYASLLGLNAHKLEPPRNMVAFEGFDFLMFTNAVGALIKSGRRGDQTNLLNSLSDRKQRKQTEYFITVGGVALVSIAIIMLGFALIKLYIGDINRDISDIHVKLNAPGLSDKLTEIEEKEKILTEYETYAEHARRARTAFASKPKISLEAFTELERYLGKDIAILDITKEEQALTVNLVAKHQDLPAQYASALTKGGYFDSITYGGFADIAEGKTDIKTSSSIILLPGSYQQGQLLSENYTVKFTIIAHIKGGDAQ